MLTWDLTELFSDSLYSDGVRGIIASFMNSLRNFSNAYGSPRTTSHSIREYLDRMRGFTYAWDSGFVVLWLDEIWISVKFKTHLGLFKNKYRRSYCHANILLVGKDFQCSNIRLMRYCIVSALTYFRTSHYEKKTIRMDSFKTTPNLISCNTH